MPPDAVSRRSAALDRLPSSATAIKYRKCRSSIQFYLYLVYRLLILFKKSRFSVCCKDDRSTEGKFGTHGGAAAGIRTDGEGWDRGKTDCLSGAPDPGMRDRGGWRASRQAYRHDRTDGLFVARSFPTRRHERVGGLGPQRASGPH